MRVWTTTFVKRASGLRRSKIRLNIASVAGVGWGWGGGGVVWTPTFVKRASGLRSKIRLNIASVGVFYGHQRLLREHRV